MNNNIKAITTLILTQSLTLHHQLFAKAYKIKSIEAIAVMINNVYIVFAELRRYLQEFGKNVRFYAFFLKNLKNYLLELLTIETDPDNIDFSRVLKC